MSKVEGGGGLIDPPPSLLKASCNYFFFEASRVNEDGRTRNDGQLDMREKVNRERHLGKGLNIDGSLDKRTRAFKDCDGKMKQKPPQEKSGMRFSANKQMFNTNNNNKLSSLNPCQLNRATNDR